MSNYLYEIEQNTDAWIAFKLGKFSASSAADLLMKETTEGYKKLINRIVEERITGKTAEGRWAGNEFTERGHLLEDAAIEHFELSTFTKVHRVGIVELDDWTVCSPDGLINPKSQIQIKCPIFTTQIEYIETQKIPTNYYKQMQFELMVTGREENIFYSFHPALPAVRISVARDEELIKEIQERLQTAINQVKQKIEMIRSN